MLRMEMLPAAHGDCLWIEYGSVGDVHRILVDAGPAFTYENLRNRILALPKADRVFELLIVTHIDNDHIEGVIPLLQDGDLGCRFKDVWYNGWDHLEDLPDAPAPDDVLGAKEGEFLGVLLDDEKVPWNQAVGGERMMVPNQGDLPRFSFEGGLTLTLLSPTRRRLIELRDEWRKVAADAGFTPGDKDAIRAQLKRKKYLPKPAGMLGDDEGEGDKTPGADNSEANGSSIAVLAEYEGVKVMLTGDAYAQVLQGSLERLGATAAKPLKLDVWKLAHHGSINNFTTELMSLIQARRYLVSTSGRTFHHPDHETLDLILEHHQGRQKPQLVFNYRTETTEPWADPHHPRAGTFEAFFPEGAVVRI